ncbi:MAG TPA: formylmethanofuran dehydrogenase subunit A [Planctomycetia bacterium]|nr:formylmethanofuran dehydrogenase subunit A [Planctomycetia bacterium]
MALLKIAGGKVYDPANGIDGVVRDIWIQDGAVIAAPTDPAVRPTKTVDAAGDIVFPGGIDMHSHFAGPKVTVARKLRPEEKREAEALPRGRHRRAGDRATVPNTFATGYLYAGMGCTTAVDAAVPALFARHAHEEMQDVPAIDKGFLVLAGNNHYVLDRIREGACDRLDQYVAWLVGAAKGLGVKVVNPGGIEEWKERGRRTLVDIDAEVDGFHVTPRRIVGELAASLDRLGMPHPVHVHCNNLGAPGNAATTLATMDALDGRRGHLAHVQFHSYGGDPGDEAGFRSAVPRLAERLKANPRLSFDVGHVSFGKTTSLTGDGPLGYYLHKVTGAKWYSSDTEMETGCGIVPIEYRANSLIHSVQWAIGLEWYLLFDDPWRMALSTDHPNGGTFLKYPETIRLLMDREHRKEAIARAHPKLAERCTLPDLDREYSLYEIAIITRAAPARLLGLPHKGHLGPGADGDVAIHRPGADPAAMFALPRYVLKRGEIVVDDGEYRGAAPGETIYCEPAVDPAAVPEIRAWFESCYTVSFRNYGVDLASLPVRRAIACGGNVRAGAAPE